MDLKDIKYYQKKRELSSRRRQVFMYYVQQGLEDNEIALKMYGDSSKNSKCNVRKHMEYLIKQFLDKPDPALKNCDRRLDFIEYIEINEPNILHPNHINKNEYYEQIDKPLPSNSIYRLPLKATDKDRELITAHEYCYRQISEGIRLINIKGSRKSGKTSETILLEDRFLKLNYKVVKIDFNNIDIADMKNRKLLMNHYTNSISEQLNIKINDEAYWRKRINYDPHSGSIKKIKEILKIFNSDKDFFILIIENVDKLFDYKDTAVCFFRFTRKVFEDIEKIKQVVTYSTDCYLDLNKAESSFIVGESIALCGFTREDIQQFGKKHYVNLSKKTIDGLIDWMGGHPYLWHLALPYLKKTDFDVEKFKRGTVKNYGKYIKFLKKIRNSILSNKELVTSLNTILNADTSIKLDTNISYVLEGKGLVKRDEFDDDEENNEKWIISCQMYQDFFEKNPLNNKYSFFKQ